MIILFQVKIVLLELLTIAFGSRMEDELKGVDQKTH